MGLGFLSTDMLTNIFPTSSLNVILLSTHFEVQVLNNIMLSHQDRETDICLTLRLLMSYIYGAPSKARNANVVYIWTYVWQR